MDRSDVALKNLNPSAISQYLIDSNLLNAFDIMIFNSFAAKSDPSDEEKNMSYTAILSFVSVVLT